MCSVCVISHFGRVRLFATPWTVAHQAPLSMGFSRQEHWSGLPFPSAGDRPNSRDWTPVSYTSCVGRRVLYHYSHLQSGFPSAIPQYKIKSFKFRLYNEINYKYANIFIELIPIASNCIIHLSVKVQINILCVFPPARISIIYCFHLYPSNP